MTTADVSEADDRETLRASAAALLDGVCSPAAVRAMLDPPDAARRCRLDEAIGGVGWPGIEIAEQYGGAGARFSDIAVVLTEIGRHIAPAGIFATAVLGVGALAPADTPESAGWLTRVAGGTGRVSAGLGAQTTAQLRYDAGSLLLSGSWSYVPDADEVDLLVLLARSATGEALLLVPAGTDGLTVHETPMFDLTRRLFSVHAEDLRLPSAAVLMEGEAATATLRAVRERAALALACDSLGVAERALATTVEYVRQRVQFDRPIGSFQAVKFSCTDMLIAIESSRVLLAEALRAYDENRPDRASLVAMAKAYVCDAAARVTADAVTLHGGIGFTWEHDAHLYLKRAKLNQAWFGSSREHLRRVAELALVPARVAGRVRLN